MPSTSRITLKPYPFCAVFNLQSPFFNYNACNLHVLFNTPSSPFEFCGRYMLVDYQREWKIRYMLDFWKKLKRVILLAILQKIILRIVRKIHF
jgi:hypothetical protein